MLILQGSCGQKPNSITSEGQADSTSNLKFIDQLRQEFNSINNDSSLQKIVLDNEEFVDQLPDGGAQLSGYYRSGELKIMIQWVGFSNGNQIHEFYFKDNELIFVYEQFNSFPFGEKSQDLKHDTTVNTFEGRYYFDNKKLIHYMTKGKKPFDNNEDVESNLLEDMNYGREKLNRKIQ